MINSSRVRRFYAQSHAQDASGLAVSVSVKHDWKPLYWLSAALLLLALQLFSGTDAVYASLVFLFSVLTYFAVKSIGGLYTLMGCVVFYLALQNVLISQVTKVIFWQPGDNRLMWPVETIGVYDLGMAGILLAGLVYSWMGFPKRKPLLKAEQNPQRLMWLAYISTFLAIGQIIFSGTHTVNESGTMNVGGIGGMIKSFQFLTPLSVASGTAYVILISRGRRSLGLINGLAILFPMIFGIIFAIRELTVMAIVLYYLTCWAFGFRFRPVHYIVLLVGIYTAQFILFPYALYGRGYTRTGNFEKNVSKAMNLLVDVATNPAKYQAIQGRAHRHDARFLYYGRPMPTLDRMALITMTGGIVDATLREGNTEMDTITPGFLLSVPRIFFPDKPYLGTGNMLAHREPDMVAKKDRNTGISICYFADAFSSFGWPGVFIIPFLLSLALFCVYRLIFSQELRYNVLALSLLIHLAWNYSETPISPNIVEVLENSILFAVGMLVIYRLVDFATHARRRIDETHQRSLLRKPRWLRSSSRPA